MTEKGRKKKKKKTFPEAAKAAPGDPVLSLLQNV